MDGFGDFINFREDESYYHIFFNDDKEEIKKKKNCIYDEGIKK